MMTKNVFHKSIFFVFILSLTVPVFTTKAAVPGLGTQESLQVSLTTFGQTNLNATLPNRFQILVWNVFKGSRKQMLTDFSAISKNVEISLFQEAIDQSTWAKSLENENQSYQWSLARAFKTNNYHTGVATGSNTQAVSKLGYRTKGSEPVTNTPKTMLVTDYLMTNGQKLKVLNVHGINFVTNSVFYSQVDQIIQILKSHQGPLIVAGDFNTWNVDRMNYLKNNMKELDLIIVDFEPDKPWLDHIFSRGLNVVRKKVYNEINSSDHKPLWVEFEI